jgi:putative oxidoreductase
MEKIFKNKWIETVLRYLLGITFIYASIHKIAEPAEFAKIIYGYGLFPHIIINLAAIVLPFLELITGLALVLGIYPRSAATVIGALLLIFIAAISVNLIRGYEFDCGCFSFGHEGSTSSSVELLVRDSIYFIICFYLVRFPVERKWCLGKTK